MDLTVSMRWKPGDEELSKATITVLDQDGVQYGEQLLLEGETAETGLTIPEGGSCVIAGTTRPLVYDADQGAAVPWDASIHTDPNAPTAAPHNRRPPPGMPGTPASPDPSRTDPGRFQNLGGATKGDDMSKTGQGPMGGMGQVSQNPKEDPKQQPPKTPEDEAKEKDKRDKEEATKKGLGSTSGATTGTPPIPQKK